MRITNTMMINNTLRNVNRSKSTLYDLENQMSTEKKISRPSDDPVVALRALSLRSSLAEIEQYLSKNIPDAQAWIQTTETSMDNLTSVLKDIYTYCTQGATDSFTETSRSAIIDSINSLKDAIYDEANTTYDGRYIYSGYRTDTSFTFLSAAEANKEYEITENFNFYDFDTVKIISNSVNIENVDSIDAADQPTSTEVYRLRLAYNSLEEGATFTAGGSEYDMVSMTSVQFNEMLGKGSIEIDGTTYSYDDADTMYYLSDTGELMCNSDNYTAFKNAHVDEYSITYKKNGFDVGDVRPEMYFDCTDLTNNVHYALNNDQAINYQINYSQSLQVNTNGNEVISSNLARDLDDMISSISDVASIEDKIKTLTEMKSSSLYSDKQEQLDSMIEAANKELDLATDYMESLFTKQQTNIKSYQADVTLELSDLGSRGNRLTLAKNRLTAQKTTFTDLKSKNEDVELEDTVINYTSAQTIYQAAISAASNVIRQSLLDYI